MLAAVNQKFSLNLNLMAVSNYLDFQFKAEKLEADARKEIYPDHNTLKSKPDLLLKEQDGIDAGHFTGVMQNKIQ